MGRIIGSNPTRAQLESIARNPVAQTLGDPHWTAGWGYRLFSANPDYRGAPVSVINQLDLNLGNEDIDLVRKALERHGLYQGLSIVYNPKGTWDETFDSIQGIGQETIIYGKPILLLRDPKKTIIQLNERTFKLNIGHNEANITDLMRLRDDDDGDDD